MTTVSFDIQVKMSNDPSSQLTEVHVSECTFTEHIITPKHKENMLQRVVLFSLM